MKQFKEYIDAFRMGYKTHSKVREIAKKYGKPCAEASGDLREAGITLDDWNRLQFTDLSFKGIAYSLGGDISWIKLGMPSSVFK